MCENCVPSYKENYQEREEPLPKINIKSIMEIMDWLDFKAETADGINIPSWYQGDWIVVRNTSTSVDEEINYCGTACCVAGYAMIDHVDFDKQIKERGIVDPTVINLPFEDPEGNVIEPSTLTVDSMGSPTLSNHVAVRAQQKLGLTGLEASALFAAENDKERIRFLFNEFLEARGETIRV